MDVLWQTDQTKGMLGEVQNFTSMLDEWVVQLDVRHPDDTKRISICDGDYEVNPSSESHLFQCPNCGGREFEVMEGVLDGKPALGLACMKCDTYGAVFPCGL